MITKQWFKVSVLTVSLLFMLQFAFAQSTIVTGKVIDSKDRSPLSNVSVVVKDTHSGTQTDSNGNFRLSISSSVQTLTISAIGYSSQDVDVRQNDLYNRCPD